MLLEGLVLWARRSPSWLSLIDVKTLWPRKDGYRVVKVLFGTISLMTAVHDEKQASNSFLGSHRCTVSLSSGSETHPIESDASGSADPGRWPFPCVLKHQLAT